MVNNFIRKWKRWSLPSKLTAIGTFVGVLSFVYVLAWDAYKLVDTPAPWEENRVSLDKLWKNKKYKDMSHYLKNIPKQGNEDLFNFYNAIISMYHEVDLGGNKAERLLRKIKPESALYIAAQKRRLVNGMQSGTMIPTQKKILVDMEENGSKNFYYYFLATLTIPQKEYSKFHDLKSDLDLYYKKLNPSENGREFTIDGEHQNSKSADVRALLFRDLIYYSLHMNMAISSNLTCKLTGKDSYNKASKIFERNSLSFEIKHIGFNYGLINTIDKALLSSEKHCKINCGNITSCSSRT